MSYVIVEDVAASWEQYRPFAEALEGATPEGLLLHAAGPTEEGFRIVGVWESEEAWERFRADRLGPDAEAVAHVPPRSARCVRRISSVPTERQPASKRTTTKEVHDEPLPLHRDDTRRSPRSACNSHERSPLRS